MILFAQLLEALTFTPARNGKLRLIAEYFSETPDPERGWALAALTGELVFREAKPAALRELVYARVDPELFGWSYDYVGDLAETVALIWPEKERAGDVPRPARSARMAGSSPAMMDGDEVASAPPGLAQEGRTNARRLSSPSSTPAPLFQGNRPSSSGSARDTLFQDNRSSSPSSTTETLSHDNPLSSPGLTRGPRAVV